MLRMLKVVKVTMEAQLGLIGGTMGLLTGFSILSVVEIIYYVVRQVALKLQHSEQNSIILLYRQVLHVSWGLQGQGGNRQEISESFDEEKLGIETI